MNFEDESYVRVYKRKTLTTKLIGWEGRVVLKELFVEVDRAGVLDLSGETPTDAVSALTEIPVEVVRVGLERLIARGVVEHVGDALVLPRFMEAQESRQSDKVRKRESRAKRASLARIAKIEEVTDSVTNRDGRSQIVTVGHDFGQNVTFGHSEQSRAEQISAAAAAASYKANPDQDLPDSPRSAGARETPPVGGGSGDPPSGVIALPAPCNLAEAMRLPLRVRSQLCLRDPHMTGRFCEPARWPETQAFGAQVSEALACSVTLGSFPGDLGVQRVLELFAAGRTPEELQTVAASAAKDPWFAERKRRVLSSFTTAVVDRVLTAARAPQAKTARQRDDELIAELKARQRGASAPQRAFGGQSS